MVLHNYIRRHASSNDEDFREFENIPDMSVFSSQFDRDSKVRVRYACMAVYVNLGKPLISKVLINGNLQRVEYESLLVMCFFCGRYGYNNESCPHTSLPSGLSKVMDPMTGINQKIRLEAKITEESIEKESTPILKRHGKGILTENFENPSTRQFHVVVRKPKYKNQLKHQKNSGCIAGLDHSVNLLAKPVTGKGYDIGPFSVSSIKDLIGMNSSNPTGGDCVSLDNVAKAHQPSISGGMDPTEEDCVSLDNVVKAYQPFVSGGVDMALSKSNQFKKEHSLHFNPMRVFWMPIIIPP
ncbi:hypothetical protein ERO13_D07G173101v2 [Gossypium hirsutum]|nr:hypothetical protein ERO13_D07G173101v2 [Gossypium hirsutum]